MAIIVARFNGFCQAKCGRKILKGEKMVHRGPFKSFHVDCWNSKPEVNANLDVTGITTGIREPRRVSSVDPGNAAEIALAKRETSRDNREYQKGIQDYDNWKFNQSVFGEEEAERMEIEREFKEGWDY